MLAEEQDAEGILDLALVEQFITCLPTGPLRDQCSIKLPALGQEDTGSGEWGVGKDFPLEQLRVETL